MGGLRPVLGEGGASDSQAAARRIQDLPAQNGWRTQADGSAQGVLRHRLCPSDGHPVEGASKGIRQRKQRPCVFPEVGQGRPLHQALAEGPGRI